MVVVEEMVGGCGLVGCGSCARHVGAVDEEDVGPAVTVVVEDGDAGAGGFDDVTLGFALPLTSRTVMPALAATSTNQAGGRVIGGWWVGLLAEGRHHK